MKKLGSLLAVALLGAILGVACGGSKTPAAEPTPPGDGDGDGDATYGAPAYGGGEYGAPEGGGDAPAPEGGGDEGGGDDM
jgi:hypothetical protein